MQVIERFLAAKADGEEHCEDGIVLTDDFAAVIDGATDKTGRRYEGMTGGRYELLTCAGAFGSLDPGADAPSAVSWLTAAVAERLPSGLAASERPGAAFSAFSRERREIWQVGDVGYWHAGMPEGGACPRKKLDGCAAEIRAAILRAELARGVTADSLAQHDPGRQAILGLLTHGVFGNNPGAGEWAYAVIDGTAVPTGLVVVHRVPDNVSEVVLASDGYPRILPTLAASERYLAELLAQDPLCIGANRGTKGVGPGQASYDDRAYLRLAI